jgi:GAF domain-containing protein
VDERAVAARPQDAATEAAPGRLGEGGAETYVRTLEELTGLLLEEGSLLDLLEQVLALTAEAVTSCAAVSVTVVDDDGGYTTVAASSDDARAIDAAQYELSEGPCVDALRSGTPHHVTDLAADDRWPAFRDRARSLGYRTVLAVPLRAGADVIGALNVFADGPDGLNDRDVALAGRIAAPAATTLANARAYGRVSRLAAQLEQALSSRAVIEQAKGILMAGQGCEADEAFAILRQVSQASNRKLREVAAEVVARTHRT